MKKIMTVIVAVMFLIVGSTLVFAEKAPQKVIDLANSKLAGLGTDPVIVKAVKAENAKGKSLEQVKDLDKKWKANAGIADYMKAMMDSGKGVIIVDTMPYEASYRKAHIPGARQFLFPIPLMNEWTTSETGGKTPEDYEAFLGPDKEKTIVVYCGFVKCTRSHNAAMWAVNLGYKNVYRFPGRIMGWSQAGYPTAKGKK